MKMIVSCRRRPELSREAFFHHLRNVHWPLVQQHPAVLACVGGYVQNHALGEAGAALAAPFPVAGDRDSVIELHFDGDALARLMATPEYLEHVRPDEARFNDLASNVMVRTAPEDRFGAPTIGRCKRFDFIARHSSLEPQAFLDAIATDAGRLALDPFYTAHVDRHVDNNCLLQGGNEGFGQGDFDSVREVWASSFKALEAVAELSRLPEADPQRSFSVFATEFVMKTRH